VVSAIKPAITAIGAGSDPASQPSAAGTRMTSTPQLRKSALHMEFNARWPFVNKNV